MAAKTLVRPKNGLSHGITRNLANMTRKNHIKIIFKVGAKTAKIGRPNFFLTHRKTKNPRSKKFRYIRFMEILTFKIDLHPPGTPKPSKNAFLLQ